MGVGAGGSALFHDGHEFLHGGVALLVGDLAHEGEPVLAVGAGGDGDLFFDEAAGLFVETGGGELVDFVGERDFGRGLVGGEGVVEEFEDGAIEFGFVYSAAAAAGAGGFFVECGGDAGAAERFGVDQVHGAIGIGGEGDHEGGGGGGADVVDGGGEAGVVGVFLGVGAEELVGGGAGDVDGFVAVEFGVSPVGGSAEEAGGADGGGFVGVVTPHPPPAVPLRFCWSGVTARRAAMVAPSLSAQRAMRSGSRLLVPAFPRTQRMAALAAWRSLGKREKDWLSGVSSGR